MYELREAEFRTPKGNPIWFNIREMTNDWNTVSSCLGVNDEYRLRDVSPKVALDIGGYLGSVGVTIAVDNPFAQVLIVEPVPWNAELIRKNAQLNGVSKRVEVFEGAVGPPGVTTSEIRFGYRGDKNLEHHAFVGNSSLSYDTGGDVEHDTAEVETLGLWHLLDRFDLAPDWCKIDCEGAEWAFLDTPDVDRLPYIIGEAHAVRGHQGKDIVWLLESTHDVTIIGDAEGTCEFTAVLRG